MKRLFFIIFASYLFTLPLEAFLCNRPCTHRYYNPSWSNNDGLFYGYTDVNAYPYSLPVNYCFNPRPCSDDEL